MFHVEQFAPSVPCGTLLPWDRMRGTRIIGTSRDLAGLTGSQLPELKLCPFFGRNARRGEEEMFHVEHFDPAVGCSIWEHSPVGSQEKSSCCAPLGGVENSQSCVPYGTFQLECSTWNIYVIWGWSWDLEPRSRNRFMCLVGGGNVPGGRPSAQCSTWNTMLALKARVWWIVRSIAVSPTFASII